MPHIRLQIKGEQDQYFETGWQTCEYDGRTFGLPHVAPGSRRLAWTGDELWIGTLQDNLDRQPLLIHRGYIWDASWSPDGQHLLFMAEQGFFVASEPDFAPVQIIGLTGSQPVWVMPPANG